MSFDLAMYTMRKSCEILVIFDDGKTNRFFGRPGFSSIIDGTINIQKNGRDAHRAGATVQ